MVLPLRMHSLGLSEPLADTPQQVAEHFGAIQGQDLPQCLWALGLRSGTSAATVISAFNEGQLVRTWPMRGTLHVLPARDAAWMNALKPPDRLASDLQRFHELLEFPLPELHRRRDLAIELLAGNPLPRQDLYRTMAARGLEVPRRLHYRFTKYLVRTNTVVFGPIVGRDHACALADEWIPAPRALTLDEAWAELATRYVAGHGPVTDRDFARWTELGLGRARRGLADAGDRLLTIPGESGQTWWITPALATLLDTPMDDGAWRGLRLLPAYDEHILGYLDRTPQIDKKDEPLVIAGGYAVFRPTVVVNGRAVGTWTAPTPWAAAKLPPDHPPTVTITPFDSARARKIPRRALNTATNTHTTYLTPPHPTPKR